jgi:PD-(D/E)XK nuclease superfamily
MNYDPGPIPAILDRTRLVYSYTNLNCYENVCPYQFYERYIKKSTPFIETEAMRYGTKVHEAMEHRIAHKKPLHPDFAQWEPFAAPFNGVLTPVQTSRVRCELKLGVTSEGRACDFFDNAQVWLRGKLDVVASDVEKAYLVDWKTGNSNYEDRFELDVGALMLHAANPVLKKIVGNYVWLKENRLGELYDLSDTRHAWTKVTGIVKRIERDRQTGQFEKRPGPLCGFCDVKHCEHNKKR